MNVHLQHCLFPVHSFSPSTAPLFRAALLVMAVTTGVARGQKENVRERMGQDEGGQMERLLGEVERYLPSELMKGARVSD